MKRDATLRNVAIPFVVPKTQVATIEELEQLMPKLLGGHLVIHASGYHGIASGLKRWGSLWAHPTDDRLLEAQVRADLLVMRAHEASLEFLDRLRDALTPDKPVSLVFKATGHRFNGTILSYKDLHATG